VALTTALHAPRSPRRRLFSASPADKLRKRVQQTLTTPACPACCLRASMINKNNDLVGSEDFDQHVSGAYCTHERIHDVRESAKSRAPTCPASQLASQDR
jgi:hypothetical protein